MDAINKLLVPSEVSNIHIVINMVKHSNKYCKNYVVHLVPGKHSSSMARPPPRLISHLKAIIALIRKHFLANDHLRWENDRKMIIYAGKITGNDHLRWKNDR